jgi:hypothetical protein
MPFLLVLLTLVGLVILLVTLGIEVAAAGALVVTLTTATVKVVQRLNTDTELAAERKAHRAQPDAHQLDHGEPVEGAKG